MPFRRAWCPSPEPLAMQAAPFALILNSLICYLLVLLLVPLWRREPKEEGRFAGRPSRWKTVVAAPPGAWPGCLGLALAFAWLVLQRPLSYLEALAALVVGYRLLDRGLEEKYWTVILLLRGSPPCSTLSHTRPGPGRPTC